MAKLRPTDDELRAAQEKQREKERIRFEKREMERRKLEAKVEKEKAATEKLRRQLVKQGEAWMRTRPVSESATFKRSPPPYAKRSAAACFRAAANLAEVQP